MEVWYLLMTTLKLLLIESQHSENAMYFRLAYVCCITIIFTWPCITFLFVSFSLCTNVCEDSRGEMRRTWGLCCGSVQQCWPTLWPTRERWYSESTMWHCLRWHAISSVLSVSLMCKVPSSPGTHACVLVRARTVYCTVGLWYLYVISRTYVPEYQHAFVQNMDFLFMLLVIVHLFYICTHP